MSRIPYRQIAAIRTDYFEALRIFRPDRVEILRAYTPPGLLCCIRVRVHAPTCSVSKSKTVHPQNAGRWTSRFGSGMVIRPCRRPCIFTASGCLPVRL